MSLSDLVSGGAGCGPSNPLQNLGKRFGQDRGAQLDRFGDQHHGSAARGPSFRSDGPSQQQQQNLDANRFFQPGAGPSNLDNGTGPYDLASLNHALPYGPGPSASSPQPGFAAQFLRSNQQPHAAPRRDFEESFRPPGQAASPAPAAPGWAADFMKQDFQSRAGTPLSAHAGTKSPLGSNELVSHTHRPGAQGMFQPRFGGVGAMPLDGPQMQEFGHIYEMARQEGFNANGHWAHDLERFQQRHPGALEAAPQSQLEAMDRAYAQVDSFKWDTAFSAHDQQRAEQRAAVQDGMTESKPATSHDPYETDELARTAGRLVSSVEHEGNPKFRQSNFLDLMRRIRDKQAGIQGSNIVDNANGAVSVDGSQSSDKGKGKARDVPLDQRALSAEKQQAYSWANEMAARGASSQLPPSMQRALGRTTGVGGQNTSAAIPDALSYQQDMEGRQELNDLWAEEDARSEEIERQARERQRMAFVGDGGDAAAREREDDDAEAMLFNRYQGLQTGIPGANAERWTEANVTDDDSAEDFVGRAWRGTQGRGVNGAQAAEWDTLQRDWDAFEATATGMQPVGASGSTSTATSGAGYRFQTNNPYVSQTHHHAHHHAAQAQPSVFESVLEHEAAVQSDPSNAGKWFELGVKQQENEREGMAITALHQAVQLDPSFRDAWLALAVSYTNENDRTAAFGAIEHWIETSEQYRDIVRQHKAVAGDSSRAESTSSRHERLTELLIALARSAPAGEVDADVQIALGVLFNSSEDYDKAVDCFLSALSVRPDDWLLYNRLGATLSNSGRSNEALHYYHQALNLRPEFVRCHFNLSISCLNLKMYQEAAEHIYTALNLQQVESTTNGNAGADEKQASLTSSSLWETFRVTLELLGRSDLAQLCATRDVAAFDPADFVPPMMAEDEVMEPSS